MPPRTRQPKHPCAACPAYGPSMKPSADCPMWPRWTPGKHLQRPGCCPQVDALLQEVRAVRPTITRALDRLEGCAATLASADKRVVLSRLTRAVALLESARKRALGVEEGP